LKHGGIGLILYPILKRRGDIMKKILLVFTAIIVVILIGAGVMLYRAGALVEVNISEKLKGPYTFVYAERVGDYSESGKLMDEINKDLNENFKIEPTKGMGIYYDNPKKVAKENLRSELGVILDDGDVKLLEVLSTKYKIKVLKLQEYIVAEFPFENQMSIYVGMFKVYPKLEKYIEQKNLRSREMVEVYDVPNKKILYLMPLE